MTVPIEPDHALSSPIEVSSLAYEMARTRNQLVEFYRKEYQLPADAALAKVDELTSEEHIQNMLARPARETRWCDLDQLASIDPELAARRWEEIKEDARAEIVSGHWAATAIESHQDSCWKRTQFLALRGELAGQWRPRNGIEWALIDTMVQALTVQTLWMNRLVMLDVIEWPEPPSAEMAK